MKVTKTHRGFELIEFVDAYGEKSSLQESSAVTPHVWLGCDENKRHHVTQELLSPRMHLNKKQVKSLIKHLQSWLTSGSFK